MVDIKENVMISGGGKTSRILYLDITKGMLIIMLVFAHFRSASIRFDYQNADFSYIYGWNNIFTCFYMPAFFVISGFLSNLKKISSYSFIRFLKSWLSHCWHYL